jgi:cytoplasmic iron level regulating protein YaaA (DUF328/UPF0246 family)
MMDLMDNVLILATCSDHKVVSNEIVNYKAGQGIDKFLPSELAKNMYRARQQIRNLIKSNEASRNGIALKQLPYNQHIVDGMDFGCSFETGKYLPALQRYDGRFYKVFGEPSVRCSYLDDKRLKHHLLIVSGLYGLLTPTEPIQCYSCHVTDHHKITNLWREGDLLTNLIAEYIKNNNIKQVFDFMGEDSYRKLISWSAIRTVTDRNVLHCYSKQFAGAALLPSLGILAHELLTENSRQIPMKIGSRHIEKVGNDEILFSISENPDIGIAREISEQVAIVSFNDRIGRMRRNISRFLNVVVPDTKGDDFGLRVKELRKRNHREDYGVIDQMGDFNDKRNKVEYDNYILSQSDQDYINKIYDDIVYWAIYRRDCYDKAEGLEKI